MQLSCNQKILLIIFYEPFDFSLSDLPKDQQLPEHDIVNLVISVCKGLQFLKL